MPKHSKQATAFRRHFLALDRAGRERLAARAGTTVGNLKQIAYGYRAGSPEFSRRLARAAGLSLAVVRPDLWGSR